MKQHSYRNKIICLYLAATPSNTITIYQRQLGLRYIPGHSCQSNAPTTLMLSGPTHLKECVAIGLKVVIAHICVMGTYKLNTSQQ